MSALRSTRGRRRGGVLMIALLFSVLTAGGPLYGSLINDSPTPMDGGGDNDPLFNRSGLTEIPAGFVPPTVLRYDPSSCSEVL